MATTPKPGLSAGALLLGAEWAIAHGDADGFAHIAAELSRRVVGSLERELRELVRLCQLDYGVAARRWPGLRNRVQCTLALEHRPS